MPSQRMWPKKHEPMNTILFLGCSRLPRQEMRKHMMSPWLCRIVMPSYGCRLAGGGTSSSVFFPSLYALFLRTGIAVNWRLSIPGCVPPFLILQPP